MADDERPEGALFSRVYLERTEPARDSQRFRTRLYGYFITRLDSDSATLGTLIRVELGVEVPSSYNAYDFKSFFATASIRDVLDSITLLAKILDPTELKGWVSFVQRVFNEENLGYRIDQKGGVHSIVDEVKKNEKRSNLLLIVARRSGPGLAIQHKAFA